MIQPPVRRLLLHALAALGAASALRADQPALNFHLFGDIRTVAGDTSPDAHAGTQLGQLDLLVRGRISDRLTALAETVLEYDPDSRSTGVDLERLYLQFDLSDAASAGMGKRHIPFGYWNNAYHHGALFQPTIDRPTLVGFEDNGGMVPAHDTGLWLEWRDFGPAELSGAVMASNGQSGNQAHDGNNNKALTAQLSARVAGPWRLGASFRSERLSAGAPLNARSGQVDVDTRLTYVGLDTQVQLPHLLVLAEAAQVKEDRDTAAPRHTGWFAYAGLPGGEWIPYVLFERSHVEVGGALYSGFLESRSQALLGLQWNPAANWTCKGEVGRERVEGTGRTATRAQIQIAFGL